MKFSIKILLLLLLIGGLVHSSVFAQSKTVLEVEKAVETLRLALLSGNKTDLERITAEGLTYGHSSGKIEDREQFIAALASGDSDFTAIALSDQTLTIAGKTAIVRHTLSGATHNKGAEPATIKLAVMLVFVKEKKAWKLLARQAVR